MTARFEVCVVGGGPAGAAAALTLSRYTKHRVCLLEATRYEGPRVGETASAGLKPLLEYLGVGQGLGEEGTSIPSLGSAAAWGSDQILERDSLFTGRGEGYHLDRKRFDLSLVDRLREAGAVVHVGTTARRIARVDGGWELASADSPTLHAQMIVDATGRQARVARRLGGVRMVSDRLVGLVGWMDQGENLSAGSILLETTSEGWWYTAPIPGGWAVAALMTDADLLNRLGPRSEELFLGRIGETRHIRARLAGARLVEGPRVVRAESHHLAPPLGPGWVAAGDAACAFDPLTSLGIGYALSSGIQAARIVDGLLRGDDGLAREYPDDIARHVSAYRSLALQVYGAERRWEDAPFWYRRRP